MFMIHGVLAPYTFEKSVIGGCTLFFNPILIIYSFVMGLVSSFMLMRTFMYNRSIPRYALLYVTPFLLSLTFGFGIYTYVNINFQKWISELCV